MKTYIKLVLTFFALSCLPFFTYVNYAGGDIGEICMSEEEKALYDEISEYRKKRKLPPVKLSHSLTLVAKQHAFDLSRNVNVTERCNMHSWSDKGNWSACCYTSDHKESECMWNKPQELTDYSGNGYEIVFYSTYEYNSVGDYSKDALESWSKSNGHNSVILNLGVWKNLNWNSIGIGIFEGYVTVWFGVEEDTEGTVSLCK